MGIGLTGDFPMKIETIVTLSVLTGAGALPLPAQETEFKIDVPGFRPLTEHAAEFAQNATSSKIVVFPTICRKLDPNDQELILKRSAASQKQIEASLTAKGWKNTRAVEADLNLQNAAGNSQYTIFGATMKSISRQVGNHDEKADYNLTLEITRLDGIVWGIQCYILDHSGTNVFSFLLNSKHEEFVEAKLKRPDNTPEDRKWLVEESTKLAMTALMAQMKLENAIAAYKPDPIHTGKYVSPDTSSNYIEYRMDGSFAGMNNGRTAAGTFAVLNGNQIVLSIPNQLHSPSGEFKDGKLHFKNGQVWEKADPEMQKE